MAEPELLIYGVTMGAAGCAAVVAYPLVARLWVHSAGRMERYQQGKAEQAAKTLDDIFMEVKPRWLKAAYGVGPFTAALLAFAFTNNVALTLVATVVGLILPDVWVRQSKRIRQQKFQAQLVDALFILSSSLRAGLSLTQAFEQLESEMSPPASQEFGLMMKAHRLGRTLEESLQGLSDRVPSEELNLITTAVLVARETGGDVTGIITQLITTIRERKKLFDKVKTLTLQGRLQAYIMSFMPIIFATFVRTFNPQYFDQMLKADVGKTLLMIAGGLWVVGMILLMKMSKVDI